MEVRSAYDCWIKNIATWNADSGVLMNGAWAGASSAAPARAGGQDRDRVLCRSKRG